jgi:hypothetical protein
MKWAARVARVGSGELPTAFWWGSLSEIDHLEDPGVDVRIILKCIFKEGLYGGAWTGTGGGLL